MLAIIGGTSLLQSKLFCSCKEVSVQTEYGSVEVLRGDHFLFLQRHGKNSTTPPHEINHLANLAALNILGTSKIVAINSTGSLKRALVPGSLVIPDDYFNLFNIPTFFNNELKFTIPGMDENLRQLIIETALANNIQVIPSGVYFQTRGPSLETPAEIKFISKIGDVVGMTMANEAILAKELSLKFASICSVDNFANGISNTQLTIEEIHEYQSLNLEKIENLLQLVLEIFA